jgi:predicted ester cyclase
MNNQIGTERERAVRAVEAFLEGLVKSSVDGMPLAPRRHSDQSTRSGKSQKRKRAGFEFLKPRIFPKIPVRAATVERHIVEGEYVATRWDATFRDAKGSDVLVSIFDFFRVTDGLIREARFFFDPKPLKDILKLT